MPVQTWVTGQVLTPAELKSITDMLPFPSTTTVNVNPCVAGTLYICSPGLSMTLPAPTAGATIGFKLNGAAGSGVVTILRHATDLIYGPDLQVTRGVASMTISVPDAVVVLMADGTNWHVVSGAQRSLPVRITLFASGQITVTGGAQQVPGLSYTGVAPFNARVILDGIVYIGGLGSGVGVVAGVTAGGVISPGSFAGVIAANASATYGLLRTYQVLTQTSGDSLAFTVVVQNTTGTGGVAAGANAYPGNSTSGGVLSIVMEPTQ